MARTSAKFKMLVDIDRGVLKLADMAISKMALIFEAEIKRFTPTVSGNLKSSIAGTRTGVAEAQIGTNVDYAGFVEFGTSRFAPRAMFRKGAASAKTKALDFLSNFLKKNKL